MVALHTLALPATVATGLFPFPIQPQNLTDFLTAPVIDPICSEFVPSYPPRVLTRREERRWLSCIDGLLYKFHPERDLVMANSLSLGQITNFCNQLTRVQWQTNATFRMHAAQYCMQRMVYENVSFVNWETPLDFMDVSLLVSPRATLREAPPVYSLLQDKPAAITQVASSIVMQEQATARDAIAEDEPVDCTCCRLTPISSLFCGQELQEARAQAVELAASQFAQCDYKQFPRLGPSGTLARFMAAGGNASVPVWSALSKQKSMNESTYERDLDYAQAYPTAPISSQDQAAGLYQPVYVDHCETHPSDREHWVFERVGPFRAHGSEWHSAGWTDAGRFSSRVALGAWVTLFGFRSIDKTGHALPWPPIHVHHMHVTSSQSFAGPAKLSADNFTAIEFDLHGDRQCKQDEGGMNCTVRAFPSGFGLRLQSVVETLFDLKDDRPEGSATLPFYAQYIYRWTSVPMREVGKMLTGISTWSFKPHDDYLLKFPGTYPTVYVMWEEMFWPVDATMAHMYWHSHNQYTADMWAISASATALGLKELFGDRFVNVSTLGYGVESAQRGILGRLASLQREYVQDTGSRNSSSVGRAYPSLRCRLDRDRWEHWSNGEWYARYRDPHCGTWEMKKGEEFVLIGFHTRQPQAAPAVPGQDVYYWMHTVLYGIYVAPEDDPSAHIPASFTMDDMAYGSLARPAPPGEFSPHAGWP